MQVSVESKGQLQRRMKVELPEDQISEAVESRLQKLTRTAKIKGFRKGKVPLKVVKQHYGKQVRQEVVGDLIQSSFYQAVSQEKLRPAGMPAFDGQSSDTGQGLTYTVNFEVYPEIKLGSLDKAVVEKPAAEINAADMDDMLESIRRQHKEWHETDRAAQDADQVLIDFKGTIDGEAFQGGEGQDMPVEIGQGRMIAGFEEGLVGHKAGDEFTLDLTFPEEYHAKELAGKPVQFAVTIKKVNEEVLPPVDENLAKKLGIDSVDKLREEMRSNMQRELDAAIENKVKQAAMDILLEVNPIEVPQALIEEESRNMLSQMANNLSRQGMQQEQVLNSLQPAMFAEQAKRRVGLGLILAEIVKANEIKADEEKVKAKIASIAQSYDHPDEVAKWYTGDKQRMAEIESLVLEEQVVAWVLEQATVKEKKTSFKDLMNPEQNTK